MLIVGSIFTLGFFTITRGKVVNRPDGKEITESQIFGWWEIYWMQTTGTVKIFYSGDQLEMKLKILEQLKPAYMGIVSFSTKDRRSICFENSPTDAEIRDIEFSLDCHVFKGSEGVLFLYDEVPVYKFNEFTRKITNCYVCYSSVGGTLTYWTLLFYFPSIFDAAFHPETAKFLFWIIYCISLAFVNMAVKENLADKQK